jgi:hypothetical protein
MVTLQELLTPAKQEELKAIGTEAEPKPLEVEELELPKEVVEPPEPVVVEEKKEPTADDTLTQVHSELSALRKERERVRQKEAALDEERSLLAADKAVQQEAPTDQRVELKALAKEHRKALSAVLVDEDDGEAARALEDIEDKMENLRMSILTGEARTLTANEREAQSYATERQAIHEAYAFLAPDHPKANAALNESINVYMSGLISQGHPPSTAMRTAVEMFAPAYAKSLEESPGNEPDPEIAEAAIKKAEADKLITAKLARGGFSEVRSVGKADGKGFSGITPLSEILKRKKSG